MKFLQSLLLFISLFLINNVAHAQYYQSSNSPAVATTYPWIDISTTGSSFTWASSTANIYGDDALSGNIPIGFTFNYAGTNYTNIIIGSNGALFFSNANAAYSNTSLTSNTLASGTKGVFPFWDDLLPIAATKILYKTTGVSPNRVFTVSYLNIASYAAQTSSSDFQVQIYENGSFVFKYGVTYLSGASATVGIIVKNSNTKDIVQYSFNSSVITNGLTILWQKKGIDHYEIEFTPNNNSLTCVPQNLNIRACANSITPCTSVLDQYATVNAPVINTNFGKFSNGALSKTLSLTGNTTDTLSSTTIGTSILSISGATPLKCYNGSTLLASCQTTFADTGLFFDWQTNANTSADEGILDAGATSNVIKLSAVKKSDNSNSCVGFVPASNPVLNISYSDPNTGSKTVQITPTNSSGTGSISYNLGTANQSIPFTWGSNGETYLKLNYLDAGKVIINATISSPTATGSKTLISKPYSILAYNSPSDVVCADATVMTSTTSTKFCTSGETFTTKIRGYATNGAILPNFGLESAVTNLNLSGILKSPVAGSNGNIINTINSTSATLSSGVTVAKNRACTGTDCYLIASLAWDNVGEIQLLPTLVGDDYFGTGAITSKPYLPFGRFYPFSFTAIPSGIINRVAASCSTSSPFSYMDENFRALITLNAVNKAGTITTNYNGSLMNPAISSSWNIKATGTTQLNSRINFVNQSSSWNLGTLNGSLTLNFARTSLPDGSYNNIKIGIAPIDSDNVKLTQISYNMDSNLDSINDSLLLGSTNFYFGRLKIYNAVGSDLLPLPIGLEAQYYNNFGFVTNTQDNCTAFTNSFFSTANYTQNIAANELTFTYPGKLISGKQTLLMNKPSGGNGLYDGTFDLSYDLISDNKNYLLSKWTGAVTTYTEMPKGKIILSKNQGKKGVLFFKETY
jgi:MSHA biogenesis protein MshQ